MSLRTYLAGQALAGLISNAEYGAELKRRFDPDSRVAEAGEEKETPQIYVARLSLAFADALLAELGKEKA